MKPYLLTIRCLALTTAILCGPIPERASASSVTFNFDAAYNSVSSVNLGNTSGLPDLSVGLMNGQIVHGSFSYDPATDPFMTDIPLPGNGTLARFVTGPFSFSIPSLTFSALSSNAFVFDATTAGTGESFGVSADISGLSLPPDGGASANVTFISNAGNVFNSPALPALILLSDFNLAVFVVNEVDPRGQRADVFDITNLAEVSDTPLPSALSLFVGGAGLIGLMARRRKQKRTA